MQEQNATAVSKIRVDSKAFAQGMDERERGTRKEQGGLKVKAEARVVKGKLPRRRLCLSGRKRCAVTTVEPPLFDQKGCNGQAIS